MLRFAEYKTNTIDLTIDFFGYEECAPNYSYGPAVRSNYVLHYIVKGKGTFHRKGEVHSLNTGDFFLLKPNEVTFYQADEKEPWTYYWFGLSGSKTEEYFQLSTLGRDAVLRKQKHSDKVEKGMSKAIQTAQNIDLDTEMHLHLFSSLYDIFFLLHKYFPHQQTTDINPTQKIWYKTKRFIDTQYGNSNLSINSIAKHLMMNRSYLSTSFKEFQNQSPKEYLLQVRMQRASELLITTNEPIKIVAYSVGYDDPLNFSKAFRKYYQLSPSQYREAHSNHK